MGLARVLMGRMLAYLQGKAGSNAWTLPDGVQIKAISLGTGNGPPIVEIRVPGGKEKCKPIQIVLQGFGVLPTTSFIYNPFAGYESAVWDIPEGAAQGAFPYEYYLDQVGLLNYPRAVISGDTGTWRAGIWASSQFPEDGGPYFEYRYKVEDTCGNLGPWFKDDVKFGEIDWKGYDNEQRLTAVISWHGPATRYFPQSIGIFGPYVDRYSTEIYRGGMLLSQTPENYRVRGACLRRLNYTPPDGPQAQATFVIAICSDPYAEWDGTTDHIYPRFGYKDVILAKLAKNDGERGFYDEITAPNGWRIIKEFESGDYIEGGAYIDYGAGTLPNVAVSPAFFFNHDGTKAIGVRRVASATSSDIGPGGVEIRFTGNSIETLDAEKFLVEKSPSIESSALTVGSVPNPGDGPPCLLESASSSGSQQFDVLLACDYKKDGSRSVLRMRLFYESSGSTDGRSGATSTPYSVSASSESLYEIVLNGDVLYSQETAASESGGEFSSTATRTRLFITMNQADLRTDFVCITTQDDGFTGTFPPPGGAYTAHVNISVRILAGEFQRVIELYNKSGVAPDPSNEFNEFIEVVSGGFPSVVGAPCGGSSSSETIERELRGISDPFWPYSVFNGPFYGPLANCVIVKSQFDTKGNQLMCLVLPTQDFPYSTGETGIQPIDCQNLTLISGEFDGYPAELFGGTDELPPYFWTIGLVG